MNPSTQRKTPQKRAKRDTRPFEEKLKNLMWWYLRIISENKHMIGDLNTTYFYEQAASRVFLNPITAGRHIRKMLKNKEILEDIKKNNELYEAFNLMHGDDHRKR
jgi:hypothetical protein